MLLILASALLALGLALLVTGARGRRIGSSPHCRKCHFDLTGVIPDTWTPDERTRCTECGAVLNEPRAVTLGRIKRRPLALACGALLLLAALFFGGSAALQIDLTPLKPDWLLIRQCRSADMWRAGAAAEELASRMNDQQLSDAQLLELLDVYLSHAEAGVRSWGDDAWASLAAAAVGKGLATNAHRDRYLKTVLSTFDGTQQRLRDIYLRGEPFPFDHDAIIMHPDPAHTGWLIPNQVVGMAAYLQEASLDGSPLELVETWHGKERDGPREGWEAHWTRYGNPRGGGSSPALFPKPVLEIKRISPPVGEHELTLLWRIEAFMLAPGAVGTEHPFRDPDASWQAETTHSFKVISSIEELLPIIRSTGPGAQPPPRYRGPDEGLGLKVTRADKLRRDGDWYFFIEGALQREPPPSEAQYAFLASIHLEVDGVPYHTAEWQRFSDVFYDRATAAPVGPSSPSKSRSGFLLNIIDLPRVDRVDIVLTPAPEWVLRDPDRYPVGPYWGEPVIIRGVPIDWSGVLPLLDAAESDETEKSTSGGDS